MPTYQYLCDACGAEFEEFQSITDDPISVCPKCGAKPHRLISGGAGFLFKGSGFYMTDYRSKDYISKAKAEKSDSAAAKADTGKKTPGKSASSSGSASSSKSD